MVMQRLRLKDNGSNSIFLQIQVVGSFNLK